MSDPKGTTNQSFEWYEGQAGAYALGTLRGKERADFERYLAGSPQLRAEVASLMAGVKSLALAPEEMAPGADLRNRLLSTIRAEPNFVPRQAAAGRTPLAPSPAPVSLPEVRAARGWVIKPLYGQIAAALAIVIIGSLLAWNFSLRGDHGGAKTETLAQLGPLDPANDTGASGDVRYQPDDDVLLLSMKNLPALSADEVYQLWFITNDGSAPVPSVTFRPNATEGGETTIAIAADPSDFDLVAITREPGPIGSAAPTTAPFLGASV